MRSSLPTPDTLLSYDTSKKYGTYAEFGVGLAYAQIEDDKVYILSPPTSCKDYLTDALSWNDENYPAENIGMGNYRFFGDYDKENTTLWIHSDLEKRIHILNEFEDKHGIGKTLCFPVVSPSDKRKGSAVCGDPWWMSTTIHFSLYMSLLRFIQPGGDTDLSLVQDTVGGGRDSYIRPVWDQIKLLPAALRRLTITRKRNAPSIETQHSMNGHYCALTNRAIRPSLFYGPQLTEVAPELWVERKANAVY